MRATLLLLSCVLLACGSTHKAMERGARYEQAGMLSEAYGVYSDLYLRKPRSVDAHIGMQRTAQGISQRMQEEASMRYMANDLTGGDAVRGQVERYHQQQRGRGLELTWSGLVEQHRAEAIKHHADQAFQEAEDALRQQRFEMAIDAARRCLALQPERREAAYVELVATIEPIYQKGEKAMSLALWREGYRHFDRVVGLDAGYKDAMALRDSCRQRAAFSLAYVPIYNQQIYTNELGGVLSTSSIEAQLAANVKKALLDLNDPLIILVDRDNTDQLLAEQRRQLGGVYDERYSMQAGRLIGARYVLSAKILRFDDVLSRQMEVQMQLIDVSTGRILLSDLMRVARQELRKGNTRAQLLVRASEQIAARVAGFDPDLR
jgi:hypothetical protein